MFVTHARRKRQFSESKRIKYYLQNSINKEKLKSFGTFIASKTSEKINTQNIINNFENL